MTKFPVKQMSEVARIVAGFGFRESCQGNTNFKTPFIKVSDFVHAQDSWVSRANNTVNEELLFELKAKTYPIGTIIFPKVGGSLLTNKRARLGVEATFDNNVMGLIPYDIENDYLFYFMTMFDMASLANTQSIPSVNASSVSKIEVPLPTKFEQRRIATHLKAQLAEVEKARKAAEVQRKDAEALMNACLREMFCDEKLNWPTVLLGEVGSVAAGFTLGRKPKTHLLRDVPYLRVANVKDGHLDLSEVKTFSATEDEIEKWTLRAGDVLFTEGGDLDKVGRGTLWREELPECIHQNHIYRVRFPRERFLPEFVALQVRSKYAKDYFFKKAKKTTGIASINQQVLKAFPVLSPSIDIQERVVSLLSGHLQNAERILEGAQQQLVDLDLLPQKILSQAFGGGGM